MKEYEPYLKLLFAICNCDNDETKASKVIAVYDTKENEELVAVFSNSKHCAKFFNTTRKTIDCIISKQQLRKNRYKLERVIIKEEKWDNF